MLAACVPPGGPDTFTTTMRICVCNLPLLLLLPACGPQSFGSLTDPGLSSTSEISSDSDSSGPFPVTTGEPSGIAGDSTGNTATTGTTDDTTTAGTADDTTTTETNTDTVDDTTTDDTTGGCDDCVVPPISAGGNFTCAIAPGHRLRCWGLGSQGALGLGATQNIGDNELPSVAADVDVGSQIVEISAGGGGTTACARLANGGVRCWGYDQNFTGMLGQMNPATIGDDETPATIPPIDLGGAATQVSAGGSHACAIVGRGAVRCWGSNDAGRLGYGNTEDIGDDETPADAGDVDVGDTVLALAAGGTHTCALLPMGRVRCWGIGQDGQLGHGILDPLGPPELSWVGDNETPASMGDVPVGGTVVQIATGAGHSCALLDTGAVRCWGSNYFGALGHNMDDGDDIGDDETPADIGDVPLDTPVIQVAAGYQTTCALLTTGAVRCWGYNNYGQLGQGHQQNLLAAQAPDIELGGIASALSLRDDEACAALTDGTLRCWGRTFWGELGYAHTNPVGDDETPASVGPIPFF